MRDYTHIHPDFRHVLNLSDEDRIKFMDMPRFVVYKTAQQILETMQGLLHKPQRPRMPNLLLVGDPNNGKTTIVRHFHKMCGLGYVNEEAEPVKPVILAEAPPSADEKGLCISILERFFTPYRPTDPVTKMRYQVIHLFRTCHVRMLIIDEFHSLLTGTAIKQREVMNAIKLLCNELAIPVVGVGTREAVRVLHTDPQHASRFDVVSLPAWTLNKDFQRLLYDFETILPLKKQSKLYMAETALMLHAVSGGNIGNLHRLLVDCAAEAIRSGKELIDKTVIQSIIENKSWVSPTHGIRDSIG